MIQRDQRGNILFLILLAVILFAALSYAVTSSMKGGGNDARGETAQSLAAENVQYYTLIRTAIGRMKLINGCANEQISFDWNNGETSCLTSETPATNYENSNSPTNCKCHVFHALGGGVPYRPQSSFKILSYAGTANSYTMRFNGRSSVPNLGTPNSELYIAFYVRGPDGGMIKDYCQAYNDIVGTKTIDLNIAYGSVWASTPLFAGYFPNDNMIQTTFANLPAACHLYSGGVDYYGYFVLVER